MADDELVSREEAASILGVDAARIDAMVEEGMLTGQGDGGQLVTRAEVEALRLQGG
ncbi:MAG: hypothetical protein ACTHN0_12750 [Aquihabitans sp.]